MSSLQAKTEGRPSGGTSPFLEEISAMPGCENIDACVQCGTCSGVCPASPHMDHTPREIMAMIRAGKREEVLGSRAIWLCASCYSCAAECPQQIKVTQVMYALRRRALEAGLEPKGLIAPLLIRQFDDVVRARGRNSEARVMMRTYMRAKPWRHIGKMGLATRLYLKGRMTFRPDAIRRTSELDILLQHVRQRAIERAKGGAR